MSIKNKKIKMILIGALIISTFKALPNSFFVTNPKLSNPEKTVKDYFKFPQIIVQVNQSQKVEVLFTTNQIGKVDFVLAKTTDLNLKTQIEKQFFKLKLTQLKSEVVHSITLNFKTI